jgi:hypothetical protein
MRRNRRLALSAALVALVRGVVRCRRGPGWRFRRDLARERCLAGRRHLAVLSAAARPVPAAGPARLRLAARALQVTDFVTGAGRDMLRPGELLRSVSLLAESMRCRPRSARSRSRGWVGQLTAT